VGHGIVGAEVVVPCTDLAATLALFTDRLGFALEMISPADDPRRAVISGHGVRLRLERDRTVRPPTLVVRCDDPGALAERIGSVAAPVRLELVAAEQPLAVPPLQPSLTISRAGALSADGAGRAGMRYRDLIPDRQGGRFIASHITIPDAGPVPDYVHHHRVRFQMIHCVHGSVRVVYEDQGPPFELAAGDSVLQPPGIRHRVLASSAGAEVVEIGCPAEHDTFTDQGLELPTPVVRTDRDFGGQRFVHDRAAAAVWVPWRVEGFASRESGIDAATGGLAGSRVVRPAGANEATARHHGGELMFWFVVGGQITVRFRIAGGEVDEHLERADAVTIPAGTGYRIVDRSPDLELLEVTLPASIEPAPG
jgi:mannose-6-phosphate isomerase-like protein (cupin superfamily)